MTLRTLSRVPRLAAVVSAVSLGAAVPASAAGLFLTPRGVRPLARAGAFVAGADDPGALAYNPAGLAFAEDSVLLDVNVPIYETRYTRTVQPPLGGARLTLPEVLGVDPRAPIPTLAFAHGIGRVPRLTLGAGILAEIPALQNWPETLPDGSAAPQRYAILNYRGTVILKGSMGAAYRINDVLTVGASLQLLVGTFRSRLTLSTCDGVICTQPENTDFDAVTEIEANGIVVPGVQLGVVVTPLRGLRLGVAWETGYDVAQAARVRLRLPASPLFDGASLDPPDPTATVRLSLPMQLRVGVETRWPDWLRAEVAFVWEPWSVHRSIEADVRDVVLRDVQAIGDYGIGQVSIARNFRDTWSLRAGVEAAPRIQGGRPLVLRAGVMGEPSAIPNESLTAMTVDFDKVIVTAGAAYTLGGVQVELVYAYLHLFPREITTSTIEQVNPTRPPLPNPTTIGDGTYRGMGHVLGVGVRVPLSG